MRRLIDFVLGLIPLAMVGYPLYRWNAMNWNFALTTVETGFVFMFFAGLLGLYFKFVAS